MNDFLVKILQERGISRYKLSKMTGIPQSTIAEWVKNNKTPSADRLAIVADALDVSLDCLIGKTEKSATPSDGFSEKKFVPEPMLGEIRPDAVVGFALGGKNRLALVEVMISNNDDCKKYDTWSRQSHFPVEPELIVITDRKVQTRLKTTVIGTDLTELSI